MRRLAVASSMNGAWNPLLTVMSFNLVDLRCEFLCNPLGIDEPVPRFSWKLDDARVGVRQEGYRIRVFGKHPGTGNGNISTIVPFWDSGHIESDESHLVTYCGAALEPHMRYYWFVQVWNNRGEVSAQLPAEDTSVPWFETGFMAEDESTWNTVGAYWITLGGGIRERGETLYPSPYFRKIAELKEQPAKARLYITARGLYEAHINGTWVGCDVSALVKEANSPSGTIIEPCETGVEGVCHHGVSLSESDFFPCAECEIRFWLSFCALNWATASDTVAAVLTDRRISAHSRATTRKFALSQRRFAS